MKQVAIVSGKGGTGKTTVVASLAHLAGSAVTVDCDVDAANLALLLPGVDGPEQELFAGERAEVDPELCSGCGVCASVCRFDAVDIDPASGLSRVDPLACEGCRACRLVCPTEAIGMRENLAGVWMVREGPAGPLVHARLGIAQGNSGKLVARVREVARDEATARNIGIVLIDGPPGIGCPVHAAITGADLVLAVAEPTPSGEHDLGRVLELCRTFKLPTAVLINKADLSVQPSRRIEAQARSAGARLLGRLPFSPEVPRLLAQGRAPFPLIPIAEGMNRLWLQLHALLLEPPVVASQGGS